MTQWDGNRQSGVLKTVPWMAEEVVGVNNVAHIMTAVFCNLIVQILLSSEGEITGHNYWW